MSLVNDMNALFRRRIVNDCDEYDVPANIKELIDNLKKPDNTFLERLSLPIAVYPRRLTDRLKAQSGVFTLYGGKPQYNTEDKGGSLESLPNFKDLLSLSNSKKDDTTPFLKSIKIPKQYKADIRTQLFELGIHQSSVFGELDGQSDFIKQQWTTFFKPISSKKISEDKSKIESVISETEN